MQSSVIEAFMGILHLNIPGVGEEGSSEEDEANSEAFDITRYFR